MKMNLSSKSTNTGHRQLYLEIVLMIIRVTITLQYRSNMVPRTNNNGTALHAPPQRSNYVKNRTSVRCLIPTSSFAPFIIRMLLCTNCRVTLRLAFVFRPFFLRTLLTFKTYLPITSTNFVASGVSVPKERRPCRFVRRVFRRLRNLFITSASFAKYVELTNAKRL